MGFLLVNHFPPGEANEMKVRLIRFKTAKMSRQIVLQHQSLETFFVLYDFHMLPRSMIEGSLAAAGGPWRKRVDAIIKILFCSMTYVMLLVKDSVVK